MFSTYRQTANSNSWPTFPQEMSNPLFADSPRSPRAVQTSTVCFFNVVPFNPNVWRLTTVHSDLSISLACISFQDRVECVSHFYYVWRRKLQRQLCFAKAKAKEWEEQWDRKKLCRVGVSEPELKPKPNPETESHIGKRGRYEKELQCSKKMHFFSTHTFKKVRFWSKIVEI